MTKYIVFFTKYTFYWNWGEIHAPAVFLYGLVFSLLAELNCVILFFHLTYRETLIILYKDLLLVKS